MRIVAATRTRNEEDHIVRFCRTYGAFCDDLVIVDGGSDDWTVRIANALPKTHVVHFDEQVMGENGLWRNPHGKHINLCIETAEELGADWVIFDDCDDYPNYLLQEQAREILESTDKAAVLAYRMYMFGAYRYFPQMNEPGQSLWAWNVNKIQLYAGEDDPWKHRISYPEEEDILKLDFPLALLHFFAENEVTTVQKLDFYTRSGQHPELQHPLKVNGPLEDVPEFARLK